MREYYDSQVYQQQMQQEAARQRQIAQARAENTEPNPALMMLGRALEGVGRQLQASAQPSRRRAYHQATNTSGAVKS